MEEFKELLKAIDQRIEEPIIDARFGDSWKDSAKNNFDLEGIIDVAWRQGRRAILLERELLKRM